MIVSPRPPNFPSRLCWPALVVCGVVVVAAVAVVVVVVVCGVPYTALYTTTR
jgi:hypothetical protein